MKNNSSSLCGQNIIEDFKKKKNLYFKYFVAFLIGFFLVFISLKASASNLSGSLTFQNPYSVEHELHTVNLDYQGCILDYNLGGDYNASSVCYSDIGFSVNTNFFPEYFVSFDSSVVIPPLDTNAMSDVLALFLSAFGLLVGVLVLISGTNLGIKFIKKLFPNAY